MTDYYLNKSKTITEIIGVRILEENKYIRGQYNIIHVFTGENWKELALATVNKCIGRKKFIFHTLHRFQPFVKIPENRNKPFWLNNPYFTLEHLT